MVHYKVPVEDLIQHEEVLLALLVERTKRFKTKSSYLFTKNGFACLFFFSLSLLSLLSSLLLGFISGFFGFPPSTKLTLPNCN